MRMFAVLCIGLLNFNCFASISLDIDFKHFNQTTPAIFKQVIRTDFDKTEIFQLSNSNQEIEIVVTQKTPKRLANSKYGIMIDLTLYETNQNIRKVISSSKVITNLGEEAIMEKFKTESNTHPLTILKVRPNKI